MKIALLGLLGAVLLTGAGCAGQKSGGTQSPRNGYSPVDETELICYYGDRVIYAGQSYDDGCNTHTCQWDGTLLSTEKACGTE